jgi:hypothetical protein
MEHPYARHGTHAPPRRRFAACILKRLAKLRAKLRRRARSAAATIACYVKALARPRADTDAHVPFV